MHKKILFAVGGTGGHLFPAQALARELKEKEERIEILFAGGRLGSNRFFHKLIFPFQEIKSSSPFRSNPLKALLDLINGALQSLRLCREFSPDLVIGFGSFYSFPLLVAARLKKIPYLLVESNALPGRVNRIFASKAKLSAIQFQEAQTYFKGVSSLAKIPFWSREMNQDHLASDARKYFGLDSDCFTLLIFGGSQGARAINEAMLSVEMDEPFQVIHLCGSDQDADSLSQKWKKKGIKACVKPFEEKMHLALRLADLAICRSGAGTLTELIEFSLPSVLIPWPGSSERHQHKNAEVMTASGGGLLLEQDELDQMTPIILNAKTKLKSMRENLMSLKMLKREDLSTIVLRELT